MSRYRSVYVLKVGVDLTEVQLGRAQPPYLDYEALDYARLRNVLESFFGGFRGAPTIHVANDLIDLSVDLHEFEKIQNLGASKNELYATFGKEILKRARAPLGSTIDVRAHWPAKGTWPNRNSAPPPAGIPFLAEASGFEQMMHWSLWANSLLGYVPEPMRRMAAAFAGGPGRHQDEEPMLPKGLRTELESILGVRLIPETFLMRVAENKPSAWARFDHE